MAFAHIGSLGTTADKSAGTTCVITTTATAEVGNLIVVATAWDNSQTTGGDTTQLSVADSAGNTYIRLRERNESAGAADDGTLLGVFYTIVTTQLSSGGTITVTNTSSETASAAMANEFTLGSAAINLADQDLSQGQDTDPSAISLAGMTSQEYLVLQYVAQENNVGVTTTWDADYTGMTGTGTSGGGAATNQRIAGSFRIATLTGDSPDAPDNSSAVGGWVYWLGGLNEVAGGGTTHNAASTMTLTMAFATAATRIALAASALTAVFSFASAATRTATVTSASTYTFGLDTSATRDTFASSAATFTFGFTTSATRSTSAASSSTYTFGFTTSASKTTFGSSALPIVFGFTSSAGGAVMVASSLTLDMAFASQASRTATVSSASTYTVGLSTAASLEARAASSLSVVFSLTTAASKSTTATSALPIVFGFDTVATGPSVITHPAGRPGYVADYGRGRIDRTLVGRIAAGSGGRLS